MSDTYTRHLNPPQTQPLPGRETEMVANPAGGYVFTVDDWAALRRFLILGTEGGTYYQSADELTADQAQVVARCIAVDPDRVASVIAEVSTGRLAVRNTPAVFALAMLAASNTPAPAFSVLTDVCRIPTDLFQFLEFSKALGRGWGRAMKRAVGRYYTDTPVDRLALHGVKYRQRHGWTHRDALRRAHVPFQDGQRGDVIAWLAGKGDPDAHPMIAAFENIQTMVAADVDVAVELITDNRLPWEAIPDELRTHPATWRALIPGMPVGALTRQLATLARLGLLKPLTKTERAVVERLSDSEAVVASGAHPVRFLDAMLTHASGGTAGRSMGATYTPNNNVIAALDTAFRSAFQSITPSGKRMYLGIDVSGSMGFQACAGSVVMTPAQGAAAMAVVTAATEPWTHIAGFSHSMTPLQITSSSTVGEAVAACKMPFGRTDCAAPMLDAIERDLEVDTFVVYTDNETWYGNTHPSEALRRYRQHSGINARCVVVAMTGTTRSIADPKDAGMLDVSGFSADTPRIISAFAAGLL